MEDTASEVKVSVCVVTYNQENYIRECLQSLVTQETDFKFEIIVSDDCSTDKTPQIISEFYEMYPTIVKPILHKENMGPYKNFLFVHSQAAGRYIAHMDGDDYALPTKLQSQADFLDRNYDCNIVFHPMNIIDVDGNIIRKKFSNEILNYKFRRADIIKFVAIASHSSKMYRSILNDLSLPNFDVVDYTMNVIQVENKYAAYCCVEPLGVYRLGIGISGNHLVNLAVVNSLEFFLKAYPNYVSDINCSAWAWFLNNVRYNKKTKWKFLKIIVKTHSVNGLFSYFNTRNFRKELTGL